ncbi:MAG: hypothetical protein OSJ45_04260 [Lachnospiraceae bacterium]|nr:hypothetical protein [Lachnospiraceae bacterium]
MNFKESYKQEMDLLKKTPGLTSKAIESIPKKKYRPYAAWKTVFAVMAFICIIGGAVQHEKIISFAESIISRFTLSAGGGKMEFEEIKAVPMDIEGFIKDAGTKIVSGLDGKPEPPYSYYQNFNSYKDMNRVTNIVLPCADKVEYKEISVQIVPEQCCGHINAQIIYDGASYNVNGMYTTKGFNQDSWGFGELNDERIEKYKYGNGKNACFIKDSDSYDYDVVYFSEENILFKMSFNNGKSIKNGDATATKEQVKKLLGFFGDNK